VNSPVYNQATQEMLSAYLGDLKQLFVYQYSQYAPVFENVICDWSLNDVKSLEKYCEMGEYLVIHGLHYSMEEVSEIPEQIAKRLIWCVWGHDLYDYKTATFSITKVMTFAKKLLRPILKRQSWKHMNYEYKRYLNRMRDFAGVFVGFSQDEEIVRKKFGKQMKVFHAQYPVGTCADILLSLESDITSYANHQRKVQVLVGHSSAPNQHHEKILKKLQKYRGRVEVHIPLSYGYGGKKYSQKVTKRAKQLFGEDAHIYADFVDNEDYVNILRNIDIAVLDHSQQAALGNVYMLLFLDKKVYLNKKGVVSKGLRQAGLTIFDARTIGMESFESFSSKVSENKNREYAKNCLDSQVLAKDWRKAFDEIKARGKNNSI